MKVWTLVAILHASPGNYVATHKFTLEEVCKVVAADLMKQKPGLIAVCIDS